MKNIIKNTAGILVYIEHHNGVICPVSLELIGKALSLSAQKKEEVYAIAIGSEPEFLENSLQGYGIEKIYLYRVRQAFRADLYEEVLVDCIQSLCPSVVLIGGTMEGRAIAPRIAVAFHTGVTADCTQLEWSEEGNLIQTRPAFGGNIMASILTENSRPQIATVRAKIFPMCENKSHRKSKFIKKEWRTKDTDIEVSIQRMEQKINISNNKVLIVAGRGVKKKEDLQMLQELADLLGGTLASSRALVEKGWMSPNQQIGLSGNSVSPECMMTFGVSGSVQFVAGMKTTANIIAVNSDPNARIFEIAHYPICADLYEVVPRLIEIMGRKKSK